MNYYNENDPKAAAWLRQLIAKRLIPAGDVDERSILEIQSQDLNGYSQCHFFAGIGGWAYALQLAGWPTDRTVWTGSCPCQPFSVAGRGLGAADARHLWPVFGALIAERRPPIVFGEQVASALGRVWFSGVRANLEALGYAVGCSDLCAAGIGAPHIRQRLFWVADRRSVRSAPRFSGQDQGQEGNTDIPNNAGGPTSWGGGAPRLVYAQLPGLEGLRWHEHNGDKSGWDDTEQGRSIAASGPASPWSQFDLLRCRDGKARRVEPGTFPLAHGLPGRVGLLRGYGNAIIPQLAAEFIQAFLET